MRTQLNNNDVQLGQALPWDLYNSDGRRIFRKGFVIHTEQALYRLYRLVLFYDPTSAPGDDKNVVKLDSPDIQSTRKIRYEFRLDQDPQEFLVRGEFFQFLDFCVYLARHICEQIATGSVEQKERIEDLANNIELLFSYHEEACIGAVHLEFDAHPYSSLHPIYAAILCLLMAKALGYTRENRSRLLCAALTANLGMYEYHDDLVCKSDQLSDVEYMLLKKHPEISRRFLEANGVNDRLWLDIVMQSHERLDGTGYPRGLAGDDIRHEARIYNVVDTYLSLVMPRAYRQHKQPKQAMKEIYQMAVAEQNVLSIGLIKKLGIYPPGSCVLLRNDEIGIVIERNPILSTAPKVMTLALADGRRIRPPVIRDTTLNHLKIIDAIGSHYIKGIDPGVLWQMEPLETDQFSTR